jgi:hypothetical protein
MPPARARWFKGLLLIAAYAILQNAFVQLPQGADAVAPRHFSARRLLQTRDP